MIEQSQDEAFLYERVERRVKTLIESGALRAGERVPSLRSMSTQARVSVTTVMQAYLALERKGYIEARPRSGYFVQRRSLETTLPRARASAAKASKVRLSDTIGAILSAAHSPGIVSLGLANPSPELLPDKALSRAVSLMTRRHRAVSMGYSPPAGNDLLRRQIAARYAQIGCPVDIDEVMVTSGATEALAIALRAVARAGDVIAVESPCYFQILELIERLGMLAVQVRADPVNGVDLEALSQTIAKLDVKAVLCVPNFHNPLGSLMPDENKRRLVSMLAQNEVPLIEDDVYGELHFDRQRPGLAKSFDKNGRVLSCSSVSKTVAPGYRIGWLIPGRFAKEAFVIKRGTVGTTATLPQLAIAELFASGQHERHMRRVRGAYEEQVEQMRHAVAQCFPEQTRISQPRGGFVLWIELPPGVDGDELFKAALAKGVSVTPGSLFSPTRKFKNYIRVSAGLPWRNEVKGAVETLGKLARAAA